MTKRTALGLFSAALLGAVLTALFVAPSALAAVYKDISEFRYVRKTNDAALGADYTESGDIYASTLRAKQFFRVGTNGGAVDLDFGEDALDVKDVGSEWLFMVMAGGTNALTVTAGTGVGTVKTLNTLGSTCEDVGDTIRVIAYSTTQASVITACAD